LVQLARDCEGFSGAALAGVARAAASHALERAVEEFSDQLQQSPVYSASSRVPSIMDCLVIQDDFCDAITDLRNSMGTHDHSEDTVESEKDEVPASTET
jgi:SpoVK/Ycf46/Vps4 family AAA+-type ATPase